MILQKIGISKDVSFNLAPLIDVMFQLIIFFMLTSNMNENYTIDIDPPSVENQNRQITESDTPVVNIEQNNSYIFGSRTVNFSELTKLLDDYYKSEMKPITVMADKNSSLWPTIKLLNYCQDKRYKVQYYVDKAQNDRAQN